MNGFPVLFGVFAVFVALWKSSFSPGKSLRLYRTETWLCYGVTAACACGACWVLLVGSASDVREDRGELTFYLASSLAAIAASQALFAFLGVSLRDDVIERRNRGALFAFAGLTIGASCCIAGANAGNGPGAEVVLLCAVVSFLGSDLARLCPLYLAAVGGGEPGDALRANVEPQSARATLEHGDVNVSRCRIGHARLRLRGLGGQTVTQSPITAGPDLDLETWRRLRLRAIFDYCKWDPHSGDHEVLGRFPLILPQATVDDLAAFAEALTSEALAAEKEILA